MNPELAGKEAGEEISHNLAFFDVVEHGIFTSVIQVRRRGGTAPAGQEEVRDRS